jgi:hypothetical protein
MVRRELTSSARDQAEVRDKIWRSVAGPIVYFAATLIAFCYPKVSALIYFLLAAFYLIPTWHPSRA